MKTPKDMTLNELARLAYDTAKSKGFYDEPPVLGTRLMLITSELAEALEADRKGKHMEPVPGRNQMGIRDVLAIKDEISFQYAFKDLVKDTFQDEIADTVIRLVDLAGCYGIDLEAHVEAKMRFNALRPHKHGKKY